MRFFRLFLLVCSILAQVLHHKEDCECLPAPCSGVLSPNPTHSGQPLVAEVLPHRAVLEISKSKLPFSIFN